MWMMKVILLLCASVILAEAGRKFERRKEAELNNVGYHKVDVLAVYFADEATSNAACRLKECKDSEVCILFKDGNATCMKEKHWRKSSEVNGFHKNRKADKLAKVRADCPACPVVRPTFVCGSDNNTYSSECRLNYKNCVDNTHVTIACQGRCPCKKASDELITEPLALSNNADAENQIDVHKNGKTSVKKECMRKEMKDLKRRLVEWFHTVIREQSANGTIDLAGKMNSAVCQRGHSHKVISYMFNYFDDDKDGKLTLAELFELEADKYEHCINPLLESCDTDVDLDLSGPEWCRCFQEKHHGEKKQRTRRTRSGMTFNF